jgi:hypothetical protein
MALLLGALLRGKLRSRLTRVSCLRANSFLRAPEAAVGCPGQG